MSNIHRIGDYEAQRPNPQYNVDWPPLQKVILPFYKFLSFNVLALFLQITMFFVSIIVAASIYGSAFTVGNNYMVSVNQKALILLGAKSVSLIRKGEVYRFFMPIFLHSNFSHILANAFFQIFFVFLYENGWGFWRTALVFIVGGFGGIVLSCIADPTSISVGSSGGLCAYIGAYIMFLIYMWNNLPDRLNRALNTAIMFLFLLLFGISTPNTDNWGHLGGLLTGLMMGTLVNKEFSRFGEKKSILRIVSAILLFCFLSGLTAAIFLLPN